MHNAAVPKKTARNSGLSTVTLIVCMAAIPLDAGIRKSAFMTKFEKAKKMPPTSAHPSAAANVIANST